MPETKKSSKKPAGVALQKEERKTANEIPLFKYFLIVDPSIHPYSRAYLVRQYQGMLKTESDWQKEMKSYEGGM